MMDWDEVIGFMSGDPPPQGTVFNSRVEARLVLAARLPNVRTWRGSRSTTSNAKASRRGTWCSAAPGQALGAAS